MEIAIIRCNSHLYFQPPRLPYTFHRHHRLGRRDILKFPVLPELHVRHKGLHFRGRLYPLLVSHEHEPEPEPEPEPDLQGDEDDEAATAREVVRRYLHQEIGLSADQSLQIASHCPNYIAMLLDAVRDIDQLSSSALEPFWGQANDSQLSFADKLYQMAKRKGDKGMLPYFESLGLALSSASYLARSLSSHKLPAIIHRVWIPWLLFLFYLLLRYTAKHTI